MGYFIEISDPRVVGRTRHQLTDILFIAVCGILCGASSFIEIEEFAEDKEEWLRKFLTLENGVRSHDTFARVLSILDMKTFEDAFFSWVKELKPKHIALDGKVVKGTSRTFQGSKTLSLVSAYSSELGIVLGQQTAAGRGSRETDAVLECLENLSLKGVVVSVDAGTGGRRVTSRVREKGGDYIVPIKKNQRYSLKEIEAIFHGEKTKKKMSVFSTKEKSHGRVEERQCELIPAKNLSAMFHNQWKDVAVILKITRKRTNPDKRYVIQKRDKAGKNYYELNEETNKSTLEEVYYVSSKTLTAEQGLNYTRKHWAIENGLHWTLDVIFQEDKWQVRDKAAAATLGLIRRLAFNLVKKNPSKGSARVKLKRAAWKDDFLEEVVFGGIS